MIQEQEILNNNIKIPKAIFIWLITKKSPDPES